MAIIYGDRDPGRPDDTLVGTIDADEIYGLTGNDTIEGSDGDTLDGGSGNDAFLLIGDVAKAIGGEGNDAFSFQRDTGSLDGNLEGGAGDDGLFLYPAEPRPSGFLPAFTFDALVLDESNSIENIECQGTIAGNRNANIFDLSGVRTLYFLDENYDQTLSQFELHEGNDTFLSGSFDAEVFGGAGDDLLVGGLGKDLLVGDNGNDTIHGGDGTNILDGGSGNDRVTGGQAGDEIFGYTGKDTLAGGAGADTVDGGVGLDRLRGGADDDRLIAGHRDVLSGGDGKDQFVFDTALRGGHVAEITDFSGKDKVLLDHDVFLNTNFGPLAKDAFVVGTEAQDKQDRIIYDEKSGALFFDLDGSGRGEAIKFATIDDHLNIDHRDFVVI